MFLWRCGGNQGARDAALARSRSARIRVDWLVTRTCFPFPVYGGECDQGACQDYDVCQRHQKADPVYVEHHGGRVAVNEGIAGSRVVTNCPL
jgi:hypothetical protein